LFLPHATAQRRNARSMGVFLARRGKNAAS
jgi:hypothetical protein